MKALVFYEFFAKSKPTPARGTLERPFAGMQQHVISQQHRDPEPLAADGADVPPVAAVGVLPHVLLQETVQSERLAALGARVRLDPGVGRQVLAEARALVERLAAGGTLVRALAGVLAHVNRQPVRQRLAADRTDTARVGRRPQRRSRPVSLGHMPLQSPLL